jgi:hypothetical protein
MVYKCHFFLPLSKSYFKGMTTCYVDSWMNGANMLSGHSNYCVSLVLSSCIYLPRSFYASVSSVEAKLDRISNIFFSGYVGKLKRCLDTNILGFWLERRIQQEIWLLPDTVAGKDEMFSRDIYQWPCMLEILDTNTSSAILPSKCQYSSI